MLKDDERRLIDIILPTGILPEVVIGIPWKRIRYILRDKWSGKDWWSYGVHWSRGWLTPKGVEALKALKEPDRKETDR